MLEWSRNWASVKPSVQYLHVLLLFKATEVLVVSIVCGYKVGTLSESMRREYFRV